MPSFFTYTVIFVAIFLAVALDHTKYYNNLPEGVIVDDNEEEESKYYLLKVFYFNPADKRIFVPKLYGIGWTINIANMYSYIAIVIVITAVVIQSQR